MEKNRARARSILMDAAKSAGILTAATGLSLLFDRLGFTHANIIMVYILGVVLISVAASHRACSLIAAAASVIIFNFLFTEPRFTLTAYEPGYPVTFVVMFLTAYITGTLALRYKEQAARAEQNAREKEEAAVLARSEQLRADLLRTISHDLRTPLTTISGNASSLLSNGDKFDEETRRQLCSDIYDDSLWLVSLVENLLSATRIEEGRMALRPSAELLSDIVEEAVRHGERAAASHTLRVDCGDELLLVKADARLIVQVIVNLIDNAAKYTPAGSTITVTAGRRGEMAEVSVADDGPGIPDGEKALIFDKFYHGANPVRDDRRSLGLGLYLCKAIVEAHGGSIRVEDNRPKGAVFRFTLPLEEVTLHE